MKLTMIGNAVLICADSYEFIKSDFYDEAVERIKKIKKSCSDVLTKNE